MLRVYTATGLFPHDNSFQITVNKFKKEISLLNRLTFSSTLWNSHPTKYFLLTFVDVVALRVPFESHQWVTLIILPIQIQCVVLADSAVHHFSSPPGRHMDVITSTNGFFTTHTHKCAHTRKHAHTDVHTHTHKHTHTQTAVHTQW